MFVGGRVTWRWRKAASHTESSLETLQDKILPATWWCLHPMQIQLIPLLWTIFVPAGLWGRVQVWHRKCWHCHRDCGSGCQMPAPFVEFSYRSPLWLLTPTRSTVAVELFHEHFEVSLLSLDEGNQWRNGVSKSFSPAL